MTSNTPSFQAYADNILDLRYAHEVNGRKEKWSDICYRVVTEVCGEKINKGLQDSIYDAMVKRQFIPGGRILSQAGREYHQTDNCFTLRAEDTREGWADLAHKTTMMFMSGGGVGVDYGLIRERGRELKKSGGISSGPLPLIEMVNAIGAAARQGGDRRGAIYASLPWDHPDLYDANPNFIGMKMEKGKLEHTNISTRFNNDWVRAYSENEEDAVLAFEQTLYCACKYGDPGFQFDWDDQVLRNACTEIISTNDEDSCCLGSLNLAKINNLQELKDTASLGVLFLLCNTMYTHTPTEKVRRVKEKNRRIGLGLMGVGEWFLQRDIPYGRLTRPQCGKPLGCHWEHDIQMWLDVYKENTSEAGEMWADKLCINYPIAIRAIAPTGTISIAAGHTTPGIEPVFHTAYQRTYNTPQGLKKEVVIDPIVQKLMDQGHDLSEIDTAYTLSQTMEGIERRLRFQAFVQGYVDNAISTTINLPPYVEGVEEEIAPVLLRYLPQLRGVTFYPDGRHNNQPVQPIDIKDAVDMQAQLQEAESCKGGICGV